MTKQDKETLRDSLEKFDWYQGIGIGIDGIILRVLAGFEEEAQKQIDSLGITSKVIIKPSFPIQAY